MDCTDRETVKVMDTLSPNRETEKSYQILTVEEVIELINLVSCALSKIEILQITPPTAKFLLDFYGWDVSWLENNLMKDRKMVFALAGIEDRCSKIKSIISGVRKAVKKLVISDKPDVCGYCYDEIVHQFDCASYCKHNFCDRCWFLLVNHQLKHFIPTPYVKCPALKCMVSYEIIMHFLFEYKVADFQNSTIRSFVQNNDYFCWCPNVNCKRIIKVENVELGEIKCNCGHVYCFKCKEQWHSPISCEMLQKWFTTWKNHRSKNLKTCIECDFIIKNQEKCPLCLTNSEDKEEKEESRQKLLTDDFYRLSYTCMCYEVGDLIIPNDKLLNLIKNCLDVDGMSPKDKSISELRRYVKYIAVFMYFLKPDHPYVESFLKYLKKLKNAIYFICDIIPSGYGETIDNESKKKIKDKMELAYYYMEILNNVITEGCSEGWWSFKEEQ